MLLSCTTIMAIDEMATKFIQNSDIDKISSSFAVLSASSNNLLNIESDNNQESFSGSSVNVDECINMVKIVVIN